MAKPKRKTVPGFDVSTLAYTDEQLERAMVTAGRARVLNPNKRAYKRKSKHGRWAE